MFTRTNRNNGQVLTDTVVPAAYVSSRRTVFMAHGWNSDGTSSWLTTMKNAFLDREDINAVIVDWGGGAQILNYAQAASNTRTCGAFTATVFQNLLRVAGSSAARMWCVGHSLGSHVCGHTGMRMPTNQRLGRVTGMDPAGPLFEGNSNKLVGLNPTSATFVDVLHTSTDLGTLRDIGHVDFYPAGGVNMPGCFRKENSEEAFESLDSEDPEQHNSCGHSRAYQYMIESIRSDCFQARQRCTNFNNIPGSCTACGGCGAFPCAFMGYAADSSCNRSGMYYLTATANVPYCTN
jgi:pimeloyl-ACP methyl ester carboxylesterase